MKTLKNHLYYLRYVAKENHGWRLFWSRNPVEYINKEFPTKEKILIVEFKKVL